MQKKSHVFNLKPVAKDDSALKLFKAIVTSEEIRENGRYVPQYHNRDHGQFNTCEKLVSMGFLQYSSGPRGGVGFKL
jgi:hypothetical protein